MEWKILGSKYMKNLQTPTEYTNSSVVSNLFLDNKSETSSKYESGEGVKKPNYIGPMA